MFGGNNSTHLDEKNILEVLSTVQDPELGRDIVSLKMVDTLKLEGDRLYLKITLTTPACPLKSRIESDIRQALSRLDGLKEVKIDFNSRVTPRRFGPMTQLLPGVAHTIAVASAKGGVGKSTMSVGLAVALQQSGARVGLLDADIHGPNIPIMLGVEIPPAQEGERLIPAESHGVKLISTAFFMQADTPAIWRGPMVGKMIQELLMRVDWGELDYLIVDLPPGTGDASLTLAQSVPLSGAVIVTTPQDVALADVGRGIAMFKKLNVPILGLIENMSYFICPHCNERTDIFGHGGEETAKRLKLDFLGEVPLHPAIRMGGDSGQPILVTAPDSPQAEAIRNIAYKVAAKISVLNLKNSSSIAGKSFIPLTPNR